MWGTAERRFARHVRLRHPFRPLFFGIPSIHSLPEAWGSWERQYAPPVLHDDCIMPISSLQLQKKAPVSCREAKRCVTQLRSRRFVTILWYLWLCSQLCYETAANQRTLVEIELLATVGWKWGCQPFSCPCSQNVTHCRKEICSTCLFKTSIPAVPVWNCKHPLSTRSLRLKVAERGSTLNQLCTMVASFQSLRCSCRKSLSYAQKWLCPRFLDVQLWKPFLGFVISPSCLC